MIIAAFKFALILAVMLVHLIHHSLITLIIRNEQVRLRYFLRSISWSAGMALRILNVQVQFPRGKTDLSKSIIV
jgi:hypothetical protein